LTSFGGNGSRLSTHQFSTRTKVEDRYSTKGWNLTGRASRGGQTLCYVLGDQFRQHPAQMVMKTGAVLGADPGIAGAPMLVDVLEDRQAETEHPFGPFCRGRVRLNRGKQVVNGTDQQFVLSR
jgi:hypothetical protein